MKKPTMQNPTRTAATTAILGALTFFTVTARAQAPVAEPSAEDKATARALLDEGDALTKKGSLEAARDKYKSADAIMGVPTTGLSLADAQVKLNLLVEAADTYARVQRFPSKAGEPKAFTQARAQAEKRLAELTERIPSATVKLAQGEPSDVMRVTIDDREVSAAARFLPRKLNPGKHQVVVDSGEFRGTQSFDLPERANQTVTVTLAATGQPAFKSTSTTQTPAGGGGSEPSVGTVPPIGGDRATSPPVHPGVWISVGVAGVGALVGTISGLGAFGAKRDLETQCPGGVCVTNEAKDTYARATGLANVATASFVLAAAAGGTAGLVYFLTSEPAPAASASIMPVVGPGYLGVAGSF